MESGLLSDVRTVEEVDISPGRGFGSAEYGEQRPASAISEDGEKDIEAMKDEASVNSREGIAHP